MLACIIVAALCCPLFRNPDSTSCKVSKKKKFYYEKQESWKNVEIDFLNVKQNEYFWNETEIDFEFELKNIFFKFF